MSQRTMAKIDKIEAILASMREAYEEEGVEGDFDDAHRYYVHDATEDEIESDFAKWCPNA